MPFITIALSLLMGISFLVGFYLSRKVKGKKMAYFSIAMAFVIFVAVIVCDIIPEICELSTMYLHICIVICGLIIGIDALLLLDLFIPHHDHEHKHNDESKAEHKKHLYHIALLTFFSVLIHNVFEGIAYYTVAKSSVKSALAISGGIALHNIPLGIEMSYLFQDRKDKNVFKVFALVISGTIGALIGLFIGNISLEINLIILSITCGMMLYTGLYELGIETFKDRKEKGILEGILVGAIIFALMLM